MHPLFEQELARERLERLHREAAAWRLSRRAGSQPRTVRSAVGGGLIRIGARLTGPAGARAWLDERRPRGAPAPEPDR
ncbi:MAG TPA: hypothetical protein VGB83_11715 [Actinomycetota bacterium]